MTIEAYLKYRELFESRFQPNEVGTCYITDMKKGIRDFERFISLYGHDRRVILTSGTYGVDKRKRYVVPFKNLIGTKISIQTKDWSLFEKFPDSFNRLNEQLNSLTLPNR